MRKVAKSKKRKKGKSLAGKRSAQPRVVVVTRPTEYEWLLQRHATRQQAEFFLETRAQSIDSVIAGHESFEAIRDQVLKSIPVDWRRATVTRHDLDRFLFEPGDVVVALGQDGLVANVAKYLEGQPVIGLNPDSDKFEGILVPHPPAAAADLIRLAGRGGGEFEQRSMVQAQLGVEHRLLALNEIFIGHKTHQSAKYEISFGELTEVHSSSGLIAASGTGATGWAKSIARERSCELAMPSPEDRRLVFFVREAWPSIATGTDCTEGLIDDGVVLQVTSRMDDGVIFGDGIEADRIPFGWGRSVHIGLSDQTLRLMRG